MNVMLNWFQHLVGCSAFSKCTFFPALQAGFEVRID
jgi:hypothetical protein